MTGGADTKPFPGRGTAGAEYRNPTMQLKFRETLRSSKDLQCRRETVAGARCYG